MLDVLGCSVTPYVFDNQYVTKTILYFMGPPSFSTFFHIYIRFSMFYVYIYKFFPHLLTLLKYFTDKIRVHVDNNNEYKK